MCVCEDGEAFQDREACADSVFECGRIGMQLQIDSKPGEISALFTPVWLSVSWLYLGEAVAKRTHFKIDYYGSVMWLARSSRDVQIPDFQWWCVPRSRLDQAQLLLRAVFAFEYAKNDSNVIFQYFLDFFFRWSQM